MGANRNVSAPPDLNPVRLSRAQKRDLLGMSAAAVITTALIAAPAIVPREHEAPPLVVRSIVLATVAPIHAAGQIQTPVEIRMAERAVTARRRDSAAPPASARGTRVTAVAARLDASGKPLARKLAELLTGDGTYIVRPFPTVPAERQ